MGHVPVLIEEVLSAFEGETLRTFCEGTVGLGGHARHLLEAHPEIERYFAIDRDVHALARAKEVLLPWGKKVEWIEGPFSDAREELHMRGVFSIDGFFLDLGVSSLQLDTEERGFSFQRDGDLDMRMDVGQDVSAYDLVNTLPEKELADLFYEYGEERFSRKIAKKIVTQRKKRKIRSTKELADLIQEGTPRGKIHPATRVFQALRIAVNDELSQLKKGIEAAFSLLSPQKRIAVISFHSLEDRIVKWAFREKEKWDIVTKKPIEASEAEIKRNPRSRSAKLRVAAKRGERCSD